MNLRTVESVVESVDSIANSSNSTGSTNPTDTTTDYTNSADSTTDSTVRRVISKVSRVNIVSRVNSRVPSTSSKMFLILRENSNNMVNNTLKETELWAFGGHQWCMNGYFRVLMVSSYYNMVTVKHGIDY